MSFISEVRVILSDNPVSTLAESKIGSQDDCWAAIGKLQDEMGQKRNLRNLAAIQPFLNNLQYLAAMIQHISGPDDFDVLWAPTAVLLRLSSTRNESFDTVRDIHCDFANCFTDSVVKGLFLDGLLSFFRESLMKFYLAAFGFVLGY